MHIDQGDIGFEAFEQLKPGLAVFGLADDFDIRLRRQDQSVSGTDQFVVVDQCYADHGQSLLDDRLMAARRV